MSKKGKTQKWQAGKRRKRTPVETMILILRNRVDALAERVAELEQGAHHGA